MSQQNTESVPASKGSSDRLREIYEGMLKNDPNTNININTIKKMILFAGVPDLTQEERDSVATKASLRGRLWKILLGVTHVDGKRYLGLVERVPCVIVADKIGNDVGRTFAKELDDTKKILSPLYRLLSAFAYLSLEEKVDVMYKQGLNVVAGVFLHVMPEPDAFECFSTLVLKWLPRYYVGNVRGAYDGLHLVPFCLHEVDPVLFAHLSQNGFCYETLLEFVVSLGASTPPLGETLKLWDFLFAFGFQMVPLIPVAHLVRERTRLLSGTTPGFNSRSTSLNAKVVCDLMCVFAKTLSPGLWEMLIHHTYDPEYHKDMEAYTRYLGFDSKT